VAAETKICEACKREKPLSEFYFRKDKGKYRPACKKCKSVVTKEQINQRVNAATKSCKHCNIEKPISEYQKAGGGKWTQPYCKSCDSERKRKWEKDNKDRNKVKRNIYYKDVAKSRYVPHPKKIKTQEEKRITRVNRTSRPETKLKKSICDKKYREKNKEKIILNKKEYYYNKGGLEKAKEWQKKNMGDVGFRTKKRLRGRIYVALKRGIKSDGTMQLLGCTIEKFKSYFEALFTEGMNWDVYLAGGIHIDHIIPCKHFDLTDPDQQKKCFHYTNLQPLWELDNLKKGASLPDELKVA
jgi:hypothetical protein